MYGRKDIIESIVRNQKIEKKKLRKLIRNKGSYNKDLRVSEK